MARTTETILQQMDEAQTAQSELNALNSPSQSAIYRLWKYITAQIIQYFEQLVDLKKDEINQIAAKSVVPSDAWLKAKVLEFQYGGTASPQIVQLVNFVPTYNPVDVTKRIITRCSVKTTGARIVTVKVAKGEPPVALLSDELNSLKSYLTNGGNSTNVGVGIGFAGIQINAVSNNPDKMYLKSDIIFNGQYSATIKDGVKNAIIQYLADISSLVHFDGSIKVLDLVDYIQAVPGVYDIKIQHLGLRAGSTPFASQTYLVKAFTQLLTECQTFAGYAVIEPNFVAPSPQTNPPTTDQHQTLDYELTYIAR